MARNRERPTDPEAERLHEVLSRLETDLTRELYTAMNDRGSMPRFKFAHDKIRTWERRHGGADFVEADATGPANPNSEREALTHWFQSLEDIWDNRTMLGLGSRKFDIALDKVVDKLVEDRRKRPHLKALIRSYEEDLKALATRRGAFELASLSNGRFPRNADESKTVNRALEVSLEVILERFLALNASVEGIEEESMHPDLRESTRVSDRVLGEVDASEEGIATSSNFDSRSMRGRVTSHDPTSLHSSSLFTSGASDHHLSTAPTEVGHDEPNYNDLDSAFFADGDLDGPRADTDNRDSSFGSLLDAEDDFFPGRRGRVRAEARAIDQLPTALKDRREPIRREDIRTEPDDYEGSADELEPTELESADWDSLWRELTKIYHHLHSALPEIQNRLNHLKPEDGLDEFTIAIETDISSWDGLVATIHNHFDQVSAIISRLQSMSPEETDRTYLDNRILAPLKDFQNAFERINSKMISISTQETRLRRAIADDPALQQQADEALREDILGLRSRFDEVATGIARTLNQLRDFVEDLMPVDQIE